MKPKQQTVCHIISGDLWAGAEVMAFHLLSSLAKSAVNVFVILLNDGRLASELRKMGMEIYIFDETKNSFISLFFKIAKVVKGRSVDIIHTHRYKENLLAFILSIFNRKAKLIATQHGMPEQKGKLFSLHEFMAQVNFFVLSHFFSKIIVVSNEMKNKLENHHGFRNESISVIHNGIPIPKNMKEKVHKTIFCIGSSGRLFPVKDYRLFVEVANILKSKHNIRFCLAGDGPENSSLVSLIDKYQLTGVFNMMGNIDDIDTFYNGLDLYINTSIHEGIPMTVLEAMSYGIPVVAPCIGGFPEIINSGCEGFLIEGRIPVAFAEKCILLSEDKALYQEMSGAARAKIAKEFSSLNMARKYTNQYLEAVKN
jgi:L-malate glycosyltransferase